LRLFDFYLKEKRNSGLKSGMSIHKDRGNCTRGPVLKANVKIGPLFSTLQDMTFFFKMKQGAAPILLEGFNGVKSQCKR
jgi:hypothetical protein